MWGDLLQFAGDLLYNWAAILTGGIPVAALAVWERWRGRNVSFRFYTAVFLGFGLAAASFQTWRQEHAARLQAEQLSSIAKNRSATRAQLQKFYIELGQLLEVQLKPDISAAEFESYKEQSNKILNAQAQWILDNMGEPALARFTDKSDMQAVRFQKAVNDVHNVMLTNQTRFLRNLKDMIESPAWDKN